MSHSDNANEPPIDQTALAVDISEQQIDVDNDSDNYNDQQPDNGIQPDIDYQQNASNDNDIQENDYQQDDIQENDNDQQQQPLQQPTAPQQDYVNTDNAPPPQPYSVVDLDDNVNTKMPMAADKVDTLAQQSQSLLKPKQSGRVSTSIQDDNLIDATIENYYSVDVLNLKYNPNAKSRFGLSAYYMVYWNSFLSFMFGGAAWSWYHGSDYIYDNNITSQTLCMVCGFYCFLSGIIVFILNLLYGKERKLRAIPIRSISYFCLSIIPFFTYVTALIGVQWLIVFAFSMMAWKNGEEYLLKDENDLTAARQILNLIIGFKNKCCSLAYCKDLFTEIKHQSQLKKYLFFTFFILFNFIYCSYWAYFYILKVNELNDCAAATCPEGVKLGSLELDGVTLNAVATTNGNGFVVSMLFPIAKYFGNLLDINCAFILLPVCRSFITKLYNMSTDQRGFAKCCNKMLSFFPLDYAITFHILMSILILLGALVHTWGHYLHYSQVPYTYHAVYGNSVWVTGCIIAVAMQLIYCTSLSAVRHGKYELFWYTHHLFIIFFVMTIFHGRNGWGPNFWKWMIVPGALYCVERLLREWNANKAVGVVSICHMNNDKAKIYCLELEKVHHIKTFREGQYVFLKSPIISRFQWHPFTISSPPDQKTVTIHIRNMGPGSWTDRLQEFYQAMSPNKCYTELYHRERDHFVPQTTGPDGKNLICIDGPISAPTQHLGEYLTSIVIGAGIGVTPMRAALESIVYYRFKRGIGHSYPDNAYCVWIVNYLQLSAYKWMCRTLKEVEDDMYEMRETNKSEMESKHLQIHIYVTSVPDFIDDDQDDDDEKELNKYQDLAIWGTHYDELLHDNTKDKIQRLNTAPFNENDIWKLMKKPTDDNQKIGDIIVHKGRPKWNELFEPIQKRHIGDKIGVMFCGPHIIANDLQLNCARYTDFDTKTRFVFHKENY